MCNRESGNDTETTEIVKKVSKCGSIQVGRRVSKFEKCIQRYGSMAMCWRMVQNSNVPTLHLRLQIGVLVPEVLKKFHRYITFKYVFGIYFPKVISIVKKNL